MSVAAKYARLWELQRQGPGTRDATLGRAAAEQSSDERRSLGNPSR